MAARLHENPGESPQILVRAIHGAMLYWRRLRDPNFEPGAMLVPETLYRKSNFTKYLESYRPAPCATPPKSALLERRAPVQSAEPLLSREEAVRRSQEITAGLTRSITARRASAHLHRENER